jgi:plastocyanin
MLRARLLTLTVLLGLIAPVLAPRPATAQEAGDGLTTAIYAGACGDELGEPAASLTQPILPEGEVVGAGDARAVATSFSTVPLSLEDLLAEDYVVASVGEEEEHAACGAIGGFPTDAGAIVIELSEQGDSGLSGVAYLAPSGAGAGQTDISLFLAGLGSAPPETPAEPTAEPTTEATTEATVEADLDAAQETMTELGAEPTAEPSEATAEATVQPTEEAAEQQGEPDALDLAWAAPIPQDIGEPGYGLTFGSYRERVSDTRIGRYYEVVPEIIAALENAGWQRQYYGNLELPADVGAGREIATMIDEYDSVDGAAAGFAFWDDWYASNDEVREDAPGIGDEAVLFRSEGISLNIMQEEVPYQRLLLLFRVAEFVIEVRVTDRFNEPPPAAEAMALGQVVLERLEAVRSGATPGLSNVVLRVEGEGVTTLRDHYRRRDGETMQLGFESAEEVIAESEAAAALGVIDRYYSYAEREDEAVSIVEPTHVYQVAVDRFDSEAAAAAWLASEPVIPADFIFHQNTGVLTPVNDAEQVGDGSTTSTFATENVFGTAQQGYLIRLTVGNWGAVVELRGMPGVPLDTAMELARAQADCLAAGSCLQRVPMPTELEEMAETIDPNEATTEVIVEVTSDGLDPGRVVIPVGGTVTWVTQEDAFFTIIVYDDEGQIANGTIQPGESFSHTFNEPGAYTAGDVFGLVGTIIVEATAEATGEDTTEANQDASVEATEEPVEEVAAATETYVSPSFGYTLSYDATQWTLVEEPYTDADGVDWIGLEAGFGSTIYFAGIPGVSDAQACVQIMTDAQTSEANVVAFEPRLDAAGVPEAGGDTADAFATTRITRTIDDGTTGDQAFYARCIELPSLGAVLVIQQFAADIVYDSVAQQREELLQGLTLP